VGLIVDSTIFIAAERKGLRATQALAEIDSRFPGESNAVSVITLAELAHGAARATTPERTESRWRFIREIRSSIPVLAVSAEAAIRAGEMDGINRSKVTQWVLLICSPEPRHWRRGLELQPPMAATST
jgi:predicted nucleic acid-binding protein